MHIDSCSTQIHGQRRSHCILSGTPALRIRFITLFCADRVIIWGGSSRWGSDLVWGCESSLIPSINDPPGTVKSLSSQRKEICMLHSRGTGGWLYLIPVKCLKCHSYWFSSVMMCSRSVCFCEMQFSVNDICFELLIDHKTYAVSSLTWVISTVDRKLLSRFLCH